MWLQQKNETNQRQHTPAGCHPNSQKGLGCVGSGKGAVKEDQAVMSSPGAKETGGSVGQEELFCRKRQARLVPWCRDRK